MYRRMLGELGQIVADEFILAFWDYLHGRIDATLLMRVRQLYLSTIVSGSSQHNFWYDACDKYDDSPKDGTIDRDEVVDAIQDYLWEGRIDRATVLAVIECYLSTSAHVVRFATSTYSVNEEDEIVITLEMRQPYGTSTVDVPIEVVGGDAGSGDFGFMRGGTGTSTTATFAASSTTTSCTLYTNQDDDYDDEEVVLGFGVFSTSTVPMDVVPSGQNCKALSGEC